MKLAAITPVYNEESLITGCVKCLENFVDQHVVLVSESPYFGKKEEEDRTADIAVDLGASVIKGTWELDHHQRNTGIKLLDYCDWIICTDVDMWMTSKDMVKLVDRLRTTKEDVLIIKQKAYWYDTDHYLINDDFKPVIAIRPDVRFIHIGNVNKPFEVIDDFYVHHINWCRPKDILKKVTTYSHAPEFDGEKWYKENFITWKEGECANLPTGKLEVGYSPLPDELKQYITEDVYVN